MDIRSGPERPASRCFAFALAIAVVTATLGTTPAPRAQAAKWSPAYARSLPDEAFAAIETTPEGKRVRHLPHHDHTGALDLPHLRSAVARWHQVKWHDPATAADARAHLDAHRAALQAGRGRPNRANTDGRWGP